MAGTLTSRFVTLAGTSYETRTETFERREHLVVPVVALVEGVVHAMNAPAPEFVPAEEFEHHFSGWDGRPIFEGHPIVDGQPVSGNLPEVLGTKRIGTVFNTTTADKKLKMEAWIDVELCEERAPDLLRRLQDGDPIEISVGTFVDTDDSKGVYKGKRYTGTWSSITPDHLALLPEGDTGACSRDAGCGVRAAKESSMNLMNLRNVPQSEIDALDAKDFAGPTKSFPIAAPEDVKAAANALGRAKGDRAAIKRKVVDIAYRKGSDYVAQLPADWKRKDEPKSALARMAGAVIGLFRTAQDADEMGRNDLSNRLQEGLSQVEENVVWVDDFYPVTDPAHVVYTCMVPNGEVYGEPGYSYPGYDYVQYERAFNLEDDGTLTIQAARVRVRSVSRWEPVAGAQPENDSAAVGITTANKAEQTTASGAPAVLSASTPGDNEADMNKAELLKALEGATECDVKALSEGRAKVVDGKIVVAAVAAEPAAPVVPAVAETPKVETPAVAAVEPKEVTLADLIAKATPDQRAAFETITRAAAEKKAASIKSLKALGARNTYTDEQLGAMDQAQLDSLVTLSGAKTEAPRVASVDFGVAGARDTSSATEAPAPPDMAEAIRAARGIKQ
jgi:hypothetical protein